MFRQTPVAAAVSMALLSLAAMPAMAQTNPDTNIQTVEVTGIRASMAKSLEVKRNAAANVEVITAEDVGKMPDKNLADSLQRLTGVAVRTDYDEAEKVSMRGTNPDMSLILFNGHTVSGGDWYVGDQASSSRSTSLSLMPSSVLNQAIVYKTSQANIVDGGMAGTINVTTRKPLAAKEKISGVISGGMSYATLPGKKAPDFDASINWKNDANTFGVIAQVFAQKRYIRRDTSSTLAYGFSSGYDVINLKNMPGITDASLAGSGYTAKDLDGVRMRGTASTEFVEGVRDRKGGMLSMEFKPNKDLDITGTGFFSGMNANNYGRLNAGAFYSMLMGVNEPFGGTNVPTNVNGQRVYATLKNPVIVNETTMYGDTIRVLKGADIAYPAGTPPQYIGNSESFYRQGARATSGFFDLDTKYRVNDDLTIKSLLSTTRGVGKTDGDQGLTYARYGTGASFRYGAVDDAPYIQYYGAGANVPVMNADGSGNKLIGRTISGLKTTDKENSGQLDAEYKVGKSFVESIETGARFADHRRDSARRYPLYHSPDFTAGAPTGYITFPGDFGNELNGPSGWDNTGFTFTPDQLKNYFAQTTKDTPDAYGRRIPSEVHVREQQASAYIMANLEGDKWSGNVGLRFVQTREMADVPTPIPAGKCQRAAPGQPAIPCTTYPGAITNAGDLQPYYDDQVTYPFKPLAGNTYYFTKTDRKFKNWLPSLNIRYELQKDMIARFGASETIGRQNYNMYGVGFGTPVCDAQGCHVTGPNPTLKPLTSKNVDGSWAWYFAPRSLVSVDLFYSKIDGYVKTGTTGGSTVDLWDETSQSMKTYAVNTSSQQGAHIAGIELAYEQPLWNTGFGITSNVSRAHTKVDDGRPMVGASEYAANLGGYYEDDKLSARLVWNYRSKYVNSSTAPSPTANSQGFTTIQGILMPSAPTMAAPVATLAFNASYNLAKNLVVSLDATNLTNVRRAYYRYSEEEQAKLDVIGRQFYVNLKYKF
jgi:iron complex outermembrane recepter protein